MRPRSALATVLAVIVEDEVFFVFDSGEGEVPPSLRFARRALPRISDGFREAMGRKENCELEEEGLGNQAAKRWPSLSLNRGTETRDGQVDRMDSEGWRGNQKEKEEAMTKGRRCKEDGDLHWARHVGGILFVDS